MTNLNTRDYKLLLEKKKLRTKHCLKKIDNGYPIQYLFGDVNFYGYKIMVNKNALIPRFETEQLVEETLKIVSKNKPLKILDLGTGSGCIAITMKKELPNSEVTAIDKSLKALIVAFRNTRLNKTKINLMWRRMEKRVSGKFDLIISNPPYIAKGEEIMPSVKKYEPKLALFAKDNGLYFYRVILNKYYNSLNKNGLIAFEIGASQKKQILSIIKEVMPLATITCQKDYSGKDRFIFIQNK